MTKRIKYLSLLMAVIMCFTLFVGCKRDVKTEPPDTDGTSADTTAKTSDTTAKPADTTTPPETNPPEPPVTPLKLGEDGYVGEYKAYKLSFFLDTIEAKEAGISEGISVIGSINSDEKIKELKDRYSNELVSKAIDMVKAIHETNSNLKNTVIISIPVPPYQEKLYTDTTKMLGTYIDSTVRCYSDRWEIDLQNVPQTVGAYVGYAFYVINSEAEKTHDNYIVKNVTKPSADPVNDTGEITDFTQYQFIAKYRSGGHYSGVISGTNDTITVEKCYPFSSEISNDKYPISGKEYEKLFDEKFFEQNVLFVFVSNYTGGDYTYKITKVFCGKEGLVVYYDGEGLPKFYDDIQYTMVNLLVLPRESVEELKYIKSGGHLWFEKDDTYMLMIDPTK